MGFSWDVVGTCGLYVLIVFVFNIASLRGQVDKSVVMGRLAARVISARDKYGLSIFAFAFQIICHLHVNFYE